MSSYNAKMSMSIQKRHPYTGILNSETSGDSKNAFLHCGDVLGIHLSVGRNLTAWCLAMSGGGTGNGQQAWDGMLFYGDGQCPVCFYILPLLMVCS